MYVEESGGELAEQHWLIDQAARARYRQIVRAHFEIDEPAVA